MQEMAKVKCLLDFYCFGGKLRFEAGKEYELINDIIESDNYNLHWSDELNRFFIKPDHDFNLMNKNHKERKQKLLDLGWVFDFGVGVWFLPNGKTYWFQEIASINTEEFNKILSIEHIKPTDL